MKMAIRPCPCGSGEHKSAMYDGHGVFLTYVCSRCRTEKILQFRPDIFERYKADEAIEEE